MLILLFSLLAVCFVSVGYVLGRLHAAAVHREGPWDDSLNRLASVMEERP